MKTSRSARRAARASLAPHLQSTPDLPRHWVVLPQSARKSALESRLLAGLFPSHVGYFPRARLHRVARPLGVEQVIFNYCVRGAGFCELRGKRFTVEAGDLMVVPRGCAHAYGSAAKRPWSVHWFHALGAQLDPLLRELGVSEERPVVYLGKSARLTALFEELRQVLEDDYAPAELLYASQLLNHLLGLMIRLRREQHREAPSAEQRVLASLRHAKQRLDDLPSVSELARVANLSTSHYAALFHELTGASPKRYFSRLRIHRGAQLLATTDQDVGAVARALGYQDPLYFSRAFRRLNGVSPSRYRELRRSAEGAS